MPETTPSLSLPISSAIPVTVCLSLISHTNVGKTTLARTLLRKDIGQVLDSEHVTDVAEAHPMVELPASKGGHRLVLWDTPGFGDSFRLLKRLKRSHQPVRSFLLETWDRFRNRPLWCSQQAVRNVQEDADVVLYLIDATQLPQDNPFVVVEMEILQWIGKPIIVVLNQLGVGDSTDLSREVAQWHSQLAGFLLVRKVVALDAFTQCWVQERALLDAATTCLEANKRDAYYELKAAWQAGQLETHAASIRCLAAQLAGSLVDREPAPKEKFYQKIGIARSELDAEMSSARQALSDRLASRSMTTGDEIIRLHRLVGQREELFNKTNPTAVFQPQEVNESLWTAVGGLLTGAAAGVAAEIKTGGLMLGGGAIVGTFAGGVGAYLLAKGFNLTKAGKNTLRWTEDHIAAQVEAALLFYLAVSHWGRGRGKWQEASAPRVWREAVQRALVGRKAALGAIWKEAGEDDVTAAALELKLLPIVKESLNQVLRSLYPNADVS